MTATTAPEREDKTGRGPSKSSSAKGLALIAATLVGISPMLQNPMSDETLDDLLHRNRKQPKTDRTPDQIAADRLYLGDQGQMGVPVMNLVAALKHAGRKIKNGRAGISTATNTTLFSFLDFGATEFLPFDKADEKGHLPWIADKRRGVMKNGASQVAVAIVRPKFLQWGLTARFTVDERIIDLSTVEALFKEAGTNAGLGDFRPQKSGPFGRFKVEKWEVIERIAAE